MKPNKSRLDQRVVDNVKGTKKGNMFTVVCRFDKEDFKQIEKLAKERNTSFAAIVRECVKSTVMF